MSDIMTFPNTWEEFEEIYGFEDDEEIYTNRSRLIQSFRVKQWLEHESAPQWIPCSERLPVAYVEVLVCQLYEDVPFIAYIDSKRRWRTDGFSISEDYEPIAWMPLPHPYKDDRK